MENEKILKIKNAAIPAFLGFIALVIIYSLFFGLAKKISDSYFPIRTISVSGEGKVVVEPDIAKISFSVVSRGIDPERVAETNNKKMNATIDFVKSEGIDAKDIKTTRYDLHPTYEYDEKIQRSFISGYELNQSVLIKVRELPKVSKILGQLPSLGINQIDSISFDVDDPEKYLVEARNVAYDKAKEKAKSMAEKNGVKLGKIINFSEYGGGVPVPYYESFGKGGDASPSVSVPSIEPGSREITVQASITYEIK
ncbi:MAG: SIMPL domain-containing protein [Patescibacteria group bacterium]|mgnify:CR=1 FL=1